jgi:predicted  nucleic acid-binding Zn-ribbon protein
MKNRVLRYTQSKGIDMTSEEELDRLKDRTDALTQSVELLVSLHRDLEIKADEREARADERAAKTERNVDRVVGRIEKMAGLAGNHEGRFRKLESE